MANRRLIVLVVLVLLVSACSAAPEPEIYRFEKSDCLPANPAKNLRVQTNKTSVAIYGLKTTDVVAHFYRTAPGGVVLKPDGATISTFSYVSIVLDSRVGVFVELWYYKFDEDGILPVHISPKDYRGPVLLTFPCLDNPGTENIQIVVGTDKLATLIAGLYWSYGVVSIREDGTVTVDRAGIKAKDKDGKGYTSVKNKQLNAYVMVKDE